MGIFTIEAIVNNSMFFYALFLIFSFVIFIIVSSLEINYYIRKNKYVTYKELLITPFAPSISIIAPVFNIEDDVIDKVRALFALQYNNFDVLIINDGSTDTTLEKLKEYYQLELVNFAVNEQLRTKEVFGYYKSKIAAFSKLTVIDKALGGKSDALNAGINISEKDLVLCIEIDCFLVQNALVKLVKPFLEDNTRVIAAGTVVHISNSCEKKNGHLINVKFPKRLLPGFQVIEYFKTFLIERLAWSRLNGLHIFSGAIGLFDKEVLIESGGYSTKVFKHGFEMIIRMCKYMYKANQDYRVVYIAEPICWVEAPSSLKLLSKQRKQWSTGNFQTFLLHKNLFLNPKYGMLGLVSFPFWILSEWLTPFFKLLCLLLFAGMAIFGNMHWEYIGILLVMIYSFAVMLSIISVLYEEKSYQSYSSGGDIMRILLLSFIEPLVYHPLTIYWKIAGSFGKKSLDS